MGKFFKASILAAGLLCLGAMQSAKADAVFTGVTVTNATGGFCTGVATCTQTELGVGGSELATVDFASGGGFTLTETSATLGTGTSSTVSVALTTPLETYSNGFGHTFCSTSTANFTVSGSTLTPGTGSECSASVTFSGTSVSFPQTGVGILTYDGSNTWTVTDNSFAVMFTTTSTPEPSSLLMLGSGLLGLMGLGFRRKALV